MNIKEIKEVLQLMKEHELAEIEIEKDGLKLKVRKLASGQMAVETLPMAVSKAAPAAQAAPAAAPAEAKPAPAVDTGTVVRSPMVGTFYTSPAPDQPSYISVGQKVKAGDVLCIIEAMKLMNEIKCEFAGTVTEIMAQNGKPVEFDQALFKIEKG